MKIHPVFHVSLLEPISIDYYFPVVRTESHRAIGDKIIYTEAMPPRSRHSALTIRIRVVRDYLRNVHRTE